MKANKKIIIIFSVLLLLIIISGVYYIIYLKIAHSTFEKYYKFRGCVELINKTENYGFCKINYGETIKIVKYQNKWYLDGDLPVSCGFINCP
jgi:hypothetical protein